MLPQSAPPPLRLALLSVLCLQVPHPAASPATAGRAPIERGCLTDGGSGEYVVTMVFDDGDAGGPTTSLKLVLDTGSANLQAVSTRCPSECSCCCFLLTHRSACGCSLI